MRLKQFLKESDESQVIDMLKQTWNDISGDILNSMSADYLPGNEVLAVRE